MVHTEKKNGHIAALAEKRLREQLESEKTCIHDGIPHAWGACRSSSFRPHWIAFSLASCSLPNPSGLATWGNRCFSPVLRETLSCVGRPWTRLSLPVSA